MYASSTAARLCTWQLCPMAEFENTRPAVDADALSTVQRNTVVEAEFVFLEALRL